MNLEKIKSIVNSAYPETLKEQLIIKLLSEDKKSIPTMLQILQVEREENDKLIMDSNAELSRALVTIDDKNVGQKGAIVDKFFVIEEIKKHYLKWQDKIRCCFKFKDLP